MSWTQFDPNTKYTNSGFEVRYCELVAPIAEISFSLNLSYTNTNYCEQRIPDFDIGAAKFQINSINYEIITFELGAIFYSVHNTFPEESVIDFEENSFALGEVFYTQISKFEERKKIDFVPTELQQLQL